MEEETVNAEVKLKPLIQYGGGYYALVSHRELDGLLGRLLHLVDLVGDKEQRDALKSEVKLRCRGWLDDEYWSSGYQNHQIAPAARITEIE